VLGGAIGGLYGMWIEVDDSVGDAPAAPAKGKAAK
jgi:hypothetical protein